MSSLFLPPSFKLAHYRLTLEALDALHLPPFKGSALRGGFGHTFKRLVCFQSRSCGERCELGNACPYGYVFETSPPEDSEVLSNLGAVPRPFVIQPPLDQRTYIPPGQRLTFGLTLVGRGINYLPYFVAVFRELGQVGLGRPLDTPQGKRRGKYRLLAIDAASPYDATTQPVYRAEDDMIRTTNLTIIGEDITAHADRIASAPLPPCPPAPLPPRSSACPEQGRRAPQPLTLNFLTPTRLKHKGRWVHDGPPFHVLVKALLGRASSLSYFHCGQRLELDFRGLIDRAAERVRIVESGTGWADWSRFSGRQKQRVEMGGLVGRVTYQGDLGEYLPLLALGELVHVGKGTVFGNGQYRLEVRSKE